MKKNYITLVILFLIVVAIISYFFISYIKLDNQAKQLNREFESKCESEIVGSTLMTTINKAIDYNEKNEIEKDSKGSFIANETNSINIDIKFLESDKVFPMEAIASLGSEEFVKNYNSRTFKCSKKEYHNLTGQIKYMYFEEVDILENN
ncbi:MAG: hypothetical protein J6M60_05550 [Clostridia bacterium]|nr:hypothetical protein [Clostridia bacterium]